MRSVGYFENLRDLFIVFRFDKYEVYCHYKLLKLSNLKMVRYKNRYITIQVSTRDKSDKAFNLKTTALHDAIKKKVKEMYGDYGEAASQAGFSAKYCNSYTKIGLIKIRHGPHMFLLNAIPKINDLGGKLVTVKILYVGATMKHCFLFIRKYQRNKLELMWKELKSEKEKKDCEQKLMTMSPAMKELMN
ncbi:uncharacterized protein LOC131664500 [Phymastichus coffea]|uniref:uncharacterized protein LOC131664500 n=1 Tax=Phymastichus coffea TaxID=108790 RepID=UPI00273CD352|nr:uncharacterized protein LOC131664500 [Phymastichus coffea]XP_058791634.1 uncharacterized protein LOC131664500 [Phymastichus coffea]